MTDLLLASKWFNGTFVFLLGLIVVFFGIALIVVIIAGIGKIMTMKNGQPKVNEDEVKPVTDTVTFSREDEGVSPEVVAAISAVLSTYYFSNESNCEFKIKKIKRIY